MNQKIYTIQIQMTCQADADRMKQICIDYKLPYWDNEVAFDYMFDGDVFLYVKPSMQFYIIHPKQYEDIVPEDVKEPITIEQFLELLNEK